MTYRERLLQKKERLGRKASYRNISIRVGKNHTSIRQALYDLPSEIPINRTELLTAIDRALSEIEAEATPMPVAA